MNRMKHERRGRLGRWVACLLMSSVLAIGVCPDGALGDVIFLEADAANTVAGFMLPVADESAQERAAELMQAFEAGDWGAAFKRMATLGEGELDVMVPTRHEGVYHSLRSWVQGVVLSLPPDGVRAFRLYFDGQAREMLAEVRGHAQPGSEAQLRLAERLVGRMLASSVGGEASELLGDLYFERGAFARAEHAWSRSLAYGESTGEAALRLEAKRVIALMRGGDRAGAHTLYAALAARYGDRSITVGGEQVAAIALLQDAVGAAPGRQLVQKDRPDAARGSALALPEQDASPAWNLPLLDMVSQSWAIGGVGNRSSSGTSQSSMDSFIPAVTGDDERVYFHWLDTVYALGRGSGKIVWQSPLIRPVLEDTSSRLGQRVPDLRSRRIVVARRTLLSAYFPPGELYGAVAGLDKRDGSVLWDSGEHDGWLYDDEQSGQTQRLSLVGDVAVSGWCAYAVVHPENALDYYLLRFNPATGNPDALTRLGSADAGYGYSGQTASIRLPQPRLLLESGSLYVLTNNGVLLAMDSATCAIDWAIRLDTPQGLSAQQIDPRLRLGLSRVRSVRSFEKHINGSDALLLHGGRLIVKQHNSEHLFVIDANTGQVSWKREDLAHDSRVVGARDGWCYFVGSKGVGGFALDGSDDAAWWNEHAIRQPGAVMQGGRLLVHGQDSVRLFTPGQAQDTDRYHNSPYYGDYGGRLYHFDGLLVSVNQTDITAFRTDGPAEP